MKATDTVKKPYNWVPLIFSALSIVGFYYSNMGILFVINQIIIRFIRDGILVIALIIPVCAGMGLNFAIVVGAICAQVGLILALDYQLDVVQSLVFMVVVCLILSTLMGYAIGICLNRVKGKEMITTIIIGFLATSVYQLVFMVGYGTVITPHNHEMMLSRGIGVRNMVDLARFRNVIDAIWKVDIFGLELPIFMIAVVLMFALVVKYVINTRFGYQMQAVGQNMENSEMSGVCVDKVRIYAMVISTVIAGIGHIVYIQNIGMLNVYTAHLNTDIFSCAALLAGGATIFKAKIKHALIGIFLFHTLFIVSPQAGQNLFGNPALGEYFRTFVAYGTIALALMVNHQIDS